MFDNGWYLSLIHGSRRWCNRLGVKSHRRGRIAGATDEEIQRGFYLGTKPQVPGFCHFSRAQALKQNILGLGLQKNKNQETCFVSSKSPKTSHSSHQFSDWTLDDSSSSWSLHRTFNRFCTLTGPCFVWAKRCCSLSQAVEISGRRPKIWKNNGMVGKHQKENSLCKFM